MRYYVVPSSGYPTRLSRGSHKNMGKPSKKRPQQHRTEDDGLRLFDAALPHTEEIDFVFTPSQKDYGIDGEIQIVKNEAHTGEFYMVQLKATKSTLLFSKCALIHGHQTQI